MDYLTVLLDISLPANKWLTMVIIRNQGSSGTHPEFFTEGAAVPGAICYLYLILKFVL